MAQRRLAAIMFTDIVGYDSLLKEDERKAIEILRKNQRIHKRLIKKFNGRWLKEMESGTLASFSSIIDAVMCALSIKKASEELNISLRLGIHQGEVIFERKDILGDGVNIASRIQNAVNTSGIVISDTVYKDIKNKEGLEIEALGTQTLKGVESPVGIYKVGCQDYSLLDFTIDTGELVRPLSFGRLTIVVGIMVIAILAFTLYYFFLQKSTQSFSESGKSVLILPFNNYLGTDTLDYFVAGMHDALITDIGKVSALNVKCKTTANAYKNTNKSIPEIADELGVNTFVETAVLCLEDSVCLQMKMFDQEENEIWIHEFKAEKSQILNLYNMVTKEISNEINVILTPEQEKMLAEYRAVDNQAYDLYMRGMVYNDQMSKEALERANQYFQLANEIDPNWAAPYRGMASVLERQYQMGFIERSMAMPKLSEYIDRALELDPNDSWVYNLSGSKAWWSDWDWEKGEQDFLKAIELNPNHAGNHAFYAHILSSFRRPEEAYEHAQKAVELDPLNPFILGLCVGPYIQAGECQAAINLIEKAISIEPKHYFTYPGLIDASICIGDFETAFEVMKDVNSELWEKYKLTEHFEAIFHEHGWLSFQEELIKINEEVFSKNGDLKEGQMADLYMAVGNYDKAMDYFEKAYEKHLPNMPYISNKTRYDKMKDNPRYISLLKKMNLPVD